MIGETVTVTINSVPWTLNRINQDSYASEYFARTAIEEVTMRIRHTNENAALGKLPMERHQIDLSRKVYATATVPEKTYQVYTVLRMPKGADPELLEQVASALCAFESAAIIDKVVGWQS